MTTLAGGPGVGDDERDGYWDALLAGDAHTAFAVSRRALARGVPLDHVLSELVADSQCRIGEMWAANTLTVAQEHQATAVSAEVLQMLSAAVDTLEGDPLLITTAAREQHSLAVQVVAEQLRSIDQRVVVLGGAATEDRLLAAIDEHHPRAVLISASLASSLPYARRQIVACRSRGVPVVVGGAGFSGRGSRARRLGADAHADSAVAALAVIAGLPVRTTPAADLTHPGAADEAAIAEELHDVARDVLAGVSRRLRLDATAGTLPLDDWRVVLATLVPHVVDCLRSALLTDDATVLVELRAWLTEVLSHRRGHDDAVDQLWLALHERLDRLPEARRLLDA